MNDIEMQAIKHIVEAMNSDSLVIFVGAGISMSSGLPSWDELIKRLKQELALSEEMTDNLIIAQLYYDVWGKQKYIEKISSIFESHSNSRPNEIHDDIFIIRPRHIITTNYDNLIETKMNDGVEKYDVIVKDSDIPYSRAKNYIVKMHGDLGEKNMVLKEEDYLDYEKNFPMISTLVASLIMNSTVLFIGYSLSDSTFNSIFRIIQKGFGENVKNAFFYTAERQSSPIIGYYKKKGLTVLSNGNLGSDKRFDGLDPKEKLKKLTLEFMELISIKKKNHIISAEDVWENLRFLDRLSFVEARIVARNTRLKGKAVLMPLDTYDWIPGVTKLFDASVEGKLIEFVQNKTLIKKFLGTEIDRSSAHIKANEVLKIAFEFYQAGAYESAKNKYREIGKEAFKRKDFWNFLVAEYCVESLNKASFGENEVPTYYGSSNFDEIIYRIIESTQGDNKALAVFFRDEINNFSFIYKKLSIIDGLLDKIRMEHHNYKQGGSSMNSNLFELKFEFESLVKFIEFNCICVYHFKEYKLVANRYFEAILNAFRISNYPTRKDDFFNGTSSVIEELELDDIKHIIPHLDNKMLNVYMSDNKLSKIRISREAQEFITGRIVEICGQKQMNNEQEIECRKYLDFLYFVEIEDVNMLVSVFEKYPIRHYNRDAIRRLLIMLRTGREKLEGDSIKRVCITIEKHIEIIYKDEHQIYNSQLYYYSEFLEYAIKNKFINCLVLKGLDYEIYSINLDRTRIKEIENMGSFISAIFAFLCNSTKSQLQELLNAYEALPTEDLSFEFMLKMIKGNVFQFVTKKEIIQEYLTEQIRKEQREGVKSLPDPRKEAIISMFTLIQSEYFSKDIIHNNLLNGIIEGVFPEVDWILYNVRTDDVIKKLLEYRTFAEVRTEFGKKDEDKQKFDSWLIRKIEEGEVHVKMDGGLIVE